MNTPLAAPSNEMVTLTEHGPTDVAEAKVVEGVLFRAESKMAAAVREKVAAAARAADKVVQEHPYKSIGIALCIGGLSGRLLARHSK